MPKWNVDKALEQLERTVKSDAPGTTVSRCLMATAVMEQYGLRPKTKHVEGGSGMVWCIAIGVMQMPKTLYYGHTIREAYLKARKALIKPRRKPSSDASRRPRRPSP